MATPMTHEQALMREVVSDIAHETASRQIAQEDGGHDDGINSGDGSGEAIHEAGAELGVDAANMDELSEEQKRAIVSRHKLRLSSRQAGGTPQKRKKKNMGFSLMVLAGALAVSYALPKLFSGLAGGAGAGDTSFVSRVKRFPVCREGAVVITDAAYGHARQTALLLADQGLHVLAGVRTKAEERSFTYDARKGLEPFRMDMSEPNDIAKLMYRLRFVAADLQRPLYGILVNTADSVLDADKKDAVVPPNYRDMSVAFNHTHMQHISEKVIDVPVLDDGYNWYVKGPLRVVQAGLALFAAAHEEFARLAADSAAAAAAGQTVCVDGVCENTESFEAPKTTATATAAEKAKKGSKKRYKSKDDAALCAAGATSRILFMTYDESSLEPPDANKVTKDQVKSFFMPSTVPKSRRQKKPEYQRNQTTTNTAAAGQNEQVLARRVNTAGLSKDVCGAPCAMNAALRSYAEQLEGALWDSHVSISRMSVSSKPYRSKTKRPANKESTIIKVSAECLCVPMCVICRLLCYVSNVCRIAANPCLLPPPSLKEADEISNQERMWVEVNTAAAADAIRSGSSSGKADSAADESEKGFVSKKERKRKERRAAVPDPLMIDPKYSKEANYAAHAFLAAFPRQVYDQHQQKPKPRRAKFLGL